MLARYLFLVARGCGWQQAQASCCRLGPQLPLSAQQLRGWLYTGTDAFWPRTQTAHCLELVCCVCVATAGRWRAGVACLMLYIVCCVLSAARIKSVWREPGLVKRWAHGARAAAWLSV